MQTPSTKKLQYFVGKVCTILTLGVNKNDFNLEQFCNFFTCQIESIDADGILGVHPITKCKNFFFLDKVVSIIEEQTISEEHPAYEEVLTEIKNSPEMKSSPFINTDMMANLASKAKMLQKN